MYLLDTGPITALDHIAVIDEILNRCIISDEKQGINNLQDKCEIEQLDNNIFPGSSKACMHKSIPLSFRAFPFCTKKHC